MLLVIRLACLVGCLAALLTPLVASEKEEPKAKPVEPNHAAKMAKGLELFKNGVSELLKTHCLACHGGESLKGDFDLSTRESLIASGFVDLDDLKQNHFMAVVKHESEPHMPKDANKLEDRETELLAQWFENGAPYDRPLVERTEATPSPAVFTEEERNFWSFRPLSPSPPPKVDSGWVRTPIDAFIVDRLNKSGIQPNPETDRRRLIRRAYFDLIGLPPPPEAVDAFVSDPAPDAYEKVIDSLLESPHYGERWARHWMDIARFAESHGYEQDYDRPHAYHYRDFLIRALNEDMPYDQFVRWQIAGDEIEPDRPMAMMATGFLGAGVFPTQLTEKEFESSRYDELDDMVNTLGTSILGLSIGCARCHSHKFDPIPALDYYRLVANFATTIRSEIELDLEPEANRMRQVEFDRKLESAKASLARYEAEKLTEDARLWLAQTELNLQGVDGWDEMEIVSVVSSAKTKFKAISDGSWLAEGKPAAKETIAVVAKPGGSVVRGLRLEALTHPSLPSKGPGRGDQGEFVLTEIKLSKLDSHGKLQETRTWSKARTSGVSSPDSTTNPSPSIGDTPSVADAIDGDRKSGWTVRSTNANDLAAVFELDEGLTLAADDRLKIELICEANAPRQLIGRFRLSTTSQSNMAAVVGSSGLREAGREAILRLKESPAFRAEDLELAKPWLRHRLPAFQKLAEELKQLEKAGPGLKRSLVQVTSEGVPHMKHHADGRGFPHFYPDVYYLNRGDVEQKRDKMEPGFLRVLMRQDADEKQWQVAKPARETRTSFRRSSLAYWLTDARHGAGHLAARVIVNRLWQHHFGTGIVATSNDFGKQGELPTHPELLDWLAVDLIQHGWHLKRMHKLMMLSAVYRQSSDANGIEHGETRFELDRENRLLWRFPIRRLEAEAIRDSLLAVSGELDKTMYGQGSIDPNMKRRSVYFFIKRSQLIPMMVLFDWPEHQVSIGNRSRTTIAPQALSLMNNPQCRQCAKAFATQIQSSDVGLAIASAYRKAFGRSPNENEQALLRNFVDRQSAAYARDQVADPHSSALVDLCQTILSMNEFIYVD